jgi:2-dehydropantoate 2-reductase
VAQRATSRAAAFLRVVDHGLRAAVVQRRFDEHDEASSFGIVMFPLEKGERPTRRVSRGQLAKQPMQRLPKAACDEPRGTLQSVRTRGRLMTKVCIVGAGAIGGLIGTRLAAAGRAHVSALARGATLDALRTHGWRMDTAVGQAAGDAPRRVQVAAARASDNAADLGVQDLVVIAVKGTALTQVARGIGPLLGPKTIVLPAMNGVPWWFCSALPGFEDGLASIDPGAEIARAIAFDRVLGCVVHASASMPEAGLVAHRAGQGLIVGEPRGGASERVREVADLLAHAGFDVTRSENVRYDVWYKLWGNLTMNPVTAITGATMDRALADPLVREFCSVAMREAAVIGERLGCPITQSPEDRHAITAKLGAVKTSMLQDVEAGRAIELDAIVTAVHEIGRRFGIATPAIDALLGLTRLFARERGLYPS